jgi:hypothetical protein
MASWASRSRWPSRRAGSPVTHFDSPRQVATLPSTVAAALSVNQGRPWRARIRNARLSSSHSPRSAPTVTSTPWRASQAAPPASLATGCTIPITARATPDAATSGAHGGRP